MRILIIDDERHVRLRLEAMLKELYSPMVEIYQGNSSKKMAEMMEKYPFDIVFLDINMPEEDGLHALAALKEKYPKTLWCVLTGYDYFNYAKQALQLGVKGYLLKPPDPDELKTFVDQAKIELMHSFRKNHEEFAENIRKGIYLADFSEKKHSGVDYTIYLFTVDAELENEVLECNKRLYTELEKFYLKYEREFALFFWKTGELCLLIDNKDDHMMKRFFFTNDSFSELRVSIAGFSTLLQDISEIRSSVSFLIGLSPLRLLMKNKEIMSIEEWEKDPYVMQKRYYCECLEKLTTQYLLDDRERFNWTIQEMICSKQKTEGLPDFYTESVVEHIGLVWGEQIKAFSTAELLSTLKQIFAHKNTTASRQDIVAQISTYVGDHYMEDVSITRVGEACNISPTYLSRVFREKTGQKYIDYVMKIRMEKAKEFLETGKFSVKKVSEMTGYVSEKHFSRIFKKYYGISPSQIV